MLFDFALEEASSFWLSALLATSVGLSVAFCEEPGRDKDVGSAANPICHIGGCAASADVVFASLVAEGSGLGVLEPLWKLFTPDGAFKTLSASGYHGLTSALCSLWGTCCHFFSSAAAKPRRDAPPSAEKAVASTSVAPTREEISMTPLLEWQAYRGYFGLFALGVFRDLVVRLQAVFLRDEVAAAHLRKERFLSGWVDFFTTHMYRLYLDCFHRPICSAPDAFVDVVVRTRHGGPLFSPLQPFKITARAQRCHNLSSYNYLGFGGFDPHCTPTSRSFAVHLGFCPAAPRTEGGTLPVHRELEGEIAEFLGKEDALVVGMGFATNSTVLPTLFEAGNAGILVISDSLNHRSIVEGVRLSGATVRAFAHNSMEALERELKRAVNEGRPGGEPFRKIFVAVEGIYSMEGDFCRLREVVTLKNRYGAYLFVDEAHSIGAVGATGRGVTEFLGVPTSEVEILMGTFTKSFGSAGGYLAASRSIVDLLRGQAPGSTCATAMAAPCAAQALAALRVISGKAGGSKGAEKLASLKCNSEFFREQLMIKGFKVLGDVGSPIVPVMLHHPRKMAAFSRLCLERGIACVVVGYPAVPVLYERVRFCMSASHTRSQLSDAVVSLTEIGHRVGVMYGLGATVESVSERLLRESAYASWLQTSPLEPRPKRPIWQPEPLDAVAASGIAADASAEALDTCARGRLDLRLNDPLGLARCPLEAAKQAIGDAVDAYGFGSCGPRGFYGTSRHHLELEEALRDFLGVQDALVYSAGVATASSVVPALVMPGDHVVADACVHLGLQAGLRLTKAKITWVPHGALDALEAGLRRAAEAVKEGDSKASRHRIFVVMEGLCRGSGRIAPLQEVLRLKERYGALLILDECFSVGTLGRNGRGLTELFGIDPARVDAMIGSLEGAVASVGGFCAGRAALIDHQRIHGAGYCYSAASPPASCAAATAMIRWMAAAEGVEAVECLRQKSGMLHEALCDCVRAAGKELLFRVSSSPDSYVQHISWIGGDKGADRLRAIAAHCASVSGLRVQFCWPGHCAVEAAFAARIGVSPACGPSLRLYASPTLTPNDIAAVGRALATAFAC